MTIALRSSDFALYLDHYLIDERHTSDAGVMVSCNKKIDLTL